MVPKRLKMYQTLVFYQLKFVMYWIWTPCVCIYIYMLIIQVRWTHYVCSQQKIIEVEGNDRTGGWQLTHKCKKWVQNGSWNHVLWKEIINKIKYLNLIFSKKKNRNEFVIWVDMEVQAKHVVVHYSFLFTVYC